MGRIACMHSLPLTCEDGESLSAHIHTPYIFHNNLKSFVPTSSTSPKQRKYTAKYIFIRKAKDMNYKKLGGSRKMRGFMCQLEVATAVCMSCDSRSVVVPAARHRVLAEEHAKLINKYSKCTRSGDVPRSLGSMPMISTATTNTATISRRSGNDIAVGSSVPTLTISKKDQEKGSQIVVPSLLSSDNTFQVVVMRVSLHCQGCAGKVKKHLSKMEGVTFFSIDLDSKRVTVMGHVSPVGVLESISKVKRAEFWP